MQFTYKCFLSSLLLTAALAAPSAINAAARGEMVRKKSIATNIAFTIVITRIITTGMTVKIALIAYISANITWSIGRSSRSRSRIGGTIGLGVANIGITMTTTGGSH